MSLERAPQRQQSLPRTVIRLARLNLYFGLSPNQMAAVIKKLVDLGLLTQPFTAAGGVGRAKCVYADEVAHIQRIGVEKALAAAEAAEDEEEEAVPCKQTNKHELEPTLKTGGANARVKIRRHDRR
jgi:hypothetical protein